MLLNKYLKNCYVDSNIDIPQIRGKLKKKYF